MRAVPTPRGQPMAVVVRSGGGHQRPTTRTIHTQTDLTWPRDLKQPTVVSSSTSVYACQTSQTQSHLTSGAVNIIATDREERSSSQQSPKPGCSSEGQAPTKPPRGTRSSPGSSNRKGGKSQAPKLNHPPNSNNVNVHNRYNVCRTRRRTIMEAINTLAKNARFYPMQHVEHEFQ